MSGPTNTPNEISIETLAQEIAVRAKRADDYVVSAALLFREVRARIEQGELGVGVKWMGWMRKNIKLSESRLFELMLVAEAEDPHKELERIRRLNRERQKAFREKAKAKKVKIEGITFDSDRAEVIRWASEAPMKDVHEVLAHIATLKDRSKRPVPGELSDSAQRGTAHLH
jgi:hypothetical protein